MAPSAVAGPPSSSDLSRKRKAPPELATPSPLVDHLRLPPAPNDAELNNLTNEAGFLAPPGTYVPQEAIDVALSLTQPRCTGPFGCQETLHVAAREEDVAQHEPREADDGSGVAPSTSQLVPIEVDAYIEQRAAAVRDASPRLAGPPQLDKGGGSLGVSPNLRPEYSDPTSVPVDPPSLVRPPVAEARGPKKKRPRLSLDTATARHPPNAVAARRNPSRKCRHRAGLIDSRASSRTSSNVNGPPNALRKIIATSAVSGICQKTACSASSAESIPPTANPSVHLASCPTPWIHHPAYRLYLQQLRRNSNPSVFSPAGKEGITSSIGGASPTGAAASTYPRITVPPLLPLITRDSLREIECASITRSLLMRHELLLEPTLQLKPNSTPPAKVHANMCYWRAIERELASGCTCTAWDAHGRLLPCACRASTAPDLHFAALEAPQAADAEFAPESSVMQIEVPSRVGPLLRELVAVMASVLLPPPSHTMCRTSSTPPHPSDARVLARAYAFPDQIPDGLFGQVPNAWFSHSEVNYVLSLIDPPYMARGLRCGNFDPRGLFEVIGAQLKKHCAPMRDPLVDSMINAARGVRQLDVFAQPSGTEGASISELTRNTLEAIHICFRILELMKIDIANHQLQHLRPFIMQTTPDLEYKAFMDRCQRRVVDLEYTHDWLQLWYVSTRDSVLAPKVARHLLIAPHADRAVRRPLVPLPSDVKMEENSPEAAPSLAPYVGARLQRHRLVQLSLIHALIDLIFDPPPPTGQMSSVPSSPGFVAPHSLRATSSVTLSAGKVPDTFYLDAPRLMALSADIADTTALYMLIMLWRHLVFCKPQPSTSDCKREQASPTLTRSQILGPTELDRIKHEIWSVGAIGGGLGLCFSPGLISGLVNKMGEPRSQEASIKKEEASPVPLNPLLAKWQQGLEDVALHIAVRAEDARSFGSEEVRPDPTTRRVPSRETLSIMKSWMMTHLQRDSALAKRLRNLLKAEVTNVVVQSTFPLGAQSTNPHGYELFMRNPLLPGGPLASPSSEDLAELDRSGLRPLQPEIFHLAQRISKLVTFNLKAYWQLYNSPGFLVDSEPKPERV